MKVDLYVNSELLEPAEDKRLISQIPLKDKMVSSHGNKEADFFFWNLETDNSAFKTLVSLIYLVNLNRDTGHKPCFTFGQIRAVELSDSLFFYKNVSMSFCFVYSWSQPSWYMLETPCHPVQTPVLIALGDPRTMALMDQM